MHKKLVLTQRAVIQVLQHHECQTSLFPVEVLLAVAPHEYGNSDDRQLSARSYANIQLLTLQTQYLQKKWLYYANSA